jgi:hypothetical protein
VAALQLFWGVDMQGLHHISFTILDLHALAG